MARQRQMLHGEESRLLRYTPKVLVCLVRELSSRIVLSKINKEAVASALLQGLALEMTTEKDQNFISDVQTAKKKLNTGNWEVLCSLDVRILVQLFLDWFYLLKDPIIPDAALSKALSRGEIRAANYELKKGGKCCFYTIRLLACWMLQVVPAEKDMRRRLFSGLAHLLLRPSSLASEGKVELLDKIVDPLNQEHQKTVERSSTFSPSLLEVEFGLLLEAAAKYWYKVLLLQRKLGPLSSISPKLKTTKSDDLWVYDKAGIEAEICSNPESVEELQSGNEDVQEYMSTVCVEDIIDEVSSSGQLVLPSATSTPISSRPESSNVSTPHRG
ncbi:uncharacterized protein LOC112348952 [Selaginella moellendorffii]|uniref:uncharacterized protein LOC112348952 n=1 Tax=Selaginella moellendorffii TaxID=88036 RepID=UPI000D1CFD9C|nr:uncharacterized protein LOC112348952 [Selaginella moellendorffii]|eukprot:XP_024538157.1 uncharacterized protein LOC112348952 [Selaginella moellendorffii]